MPAKNFLELSAEYMRYAESRMMRSKFSSVLELDRLVCEHLNPDYSASGKMTMIAEEIKTAANKKGYQISRETIFRTLKKILLARDYLMAETPEKKEQAESSVKGTGNYRKYVLQGISCLKKDRITSWEYCLARLEKTKDRQEAPGIQELSASKTEDCSCRTLSGNLTSEELISDFSNLLDAMDRLKAQTKKWMQTENLRLVECLDCLEENKSTISILQHRLAAAEKRFEHAKQIEQALESENSKLKAENDRLVIQLNEALIRLEGEKKKSKSTIIDDLLKVIEAHSDGNGNGNGNGNSKNLRKVLPLPDFYTEDRIPIIFGEAFIHPLLRLRHKNSGAANLILKKVREICDKGVENSSLKIKTISDHTTHTPVNSWQVSIKKYRFTMGFTEAGDEKKLVFHELFPRKNSPFAKHN